ncbi:hypothetical protein [Paenibacillus lemnae]|uniref:Spore coat protein n=1 Tax=Paenibacillus lemnae TaxID=1330551 RepID=A0A848M718_PAELE|nr:hypothetical protein [Paenibacillus lemnae]NMO96059.1 hypothetical protein [Paenibacillus lemnae]
MYNSQMQPLTSKELDYIVDCISNESSLAKHCAATAASVSNPAVQQALIGFMHKHEHHMDTLVQSLQSHQNLAQPSH